MLEESIVYEPRHGFPLYTTAKRYWLPEFEANQSDPLALTLIFLHATSFHKESWEPTCEKLFSLASRDSTLKIREAYVLDCPNHGAATEFNERQLLGHYNFTCEKYAKAVHHFMSGGPAYGAKVDFFKRNLVGIGHSLGANAMSMLQYMEPVLPFSSMIIVEPMLGENLKKLRGLLIKGAYERRDIWPDRNSALETLKRRERPKRWDPRILTIFVKHGIRQHPCEDYAGVTLACTRDQEAAMYRDPDGATKPMIDLNKACATRPVHVILGGVHDFMPERTHTALLDPNSGRKFASVTVVPGVGHLMVQEAPDRLGEIIYKNLLQNDDLKSKL
ncbi:Alpha/beta hydrolase fold-1 [Mycena floridula]|nr:Alpha/beta hydrolase fold-1 [Mycena floridula]